MREPKLWGFSVRQPEELAPQLVSAAATSCALFPSASACSADKLPHSVLTLWPMLQWSMRQYLPHRPKRHHHLQSRSVPLLMHRRHNAVWNGSSAHMRRHPVGQQQLRCVLAARLRFGSPFLSMQAPDSHIHNERKCSVQGPAASYARTASRVSRASAPTPTLANDCDSSKLLGDVAPCMDQKEQRLR